MNAQGLAYALGAFGLWGLTPLYWRMLDRVPAHEILMHRVVWSAIVLLPALKSRRSDLRRAAASPRTMATLAATSVFIGANWFLYIKAIEERRVLDTSLGYYITPIVNVLLGVVVLGERLPRLQALAALLAGAGVLYMVRLHGSLPWLSLTLAGTFASYALLRKTARVDALAGLMVETFLLAVPCLFGLAWLASQGRWPSGLGTWALLAGGAGMTVLPLLWFVEAARRLDLKTLGFIQFLSPTLQFLAAVAVFGEPVPRARLASFALIWAAVALYCADAALRARPSLAAAPTS